MTFVKTLFLSAIFSFGALISFNASANVCLPEDEIELWAKADYATTGDELIIEGKRYKLIGIEAPQVEKKQKFFTAGQPLAKESQERLNKILANHDLQVGIVYDRRKKDQFSRALAHLFVKDKKGNIKSVQALMLSSAFALAAPESPNFKFQKCYQDAEKRGRSKEVVLWSIAAKRPDLHYPIVKSSDIYAEDTGFRIVKGKVLKVQKTDNNIIINMDTTGIRIRPEDWRNFKYNDIRKLKGQVIEARGHLFHFKGAMFMRIFHPNAIDRLKKD